MMPLTLALALVAGGTDSLGPVKLQGLTFRAPTSWEKAQADEHSLQWSEPEAKGTLAVSVYPVDPARPAKACVKQLVEAVGGEGFAPLSLGGHPASKRSSTDFVGEGEAAKAEANKVTTVTVLGCDGRTKWVLTWTAKTGEGPRFGPMLKRILDSIRYGR